MFNVLQESGCGSDGGWVLGRLESVVHISHIQMVGGYWVGLSLCQADVRHKSHTDGGW